MPREAPLPLLSHGNGPRARPARCPSRGRKASRPPAAPRAADKSGEQCARPEGGPAAGPGTWPRDTKGPARRGRRGAGGGDRGGSLRPGRGCGHVCPQHGAPRGRRGLGDKGRVRGGRRNGRWAPAAVVGDALRRGVGRARAGFREVGPPGGQVGALSAVLAVGGPTGQELRERGANNVPRATRPNRGALGSCHGYDGGGGVRPEVTAKSVLPQSAGPRGGGGPL